ncbi:MAG: V-type ATP synthase subunit I [Candidatus Nanohaloarchaea archaeon]
MKFIRPAEMEKVSIVGLKENLRPVVERLHSMQLLDIENYDGDLEKGESLEEAEQVSQLIVDLRSTISKLPQVEGESGSGRTIAEIQENIPELNQEVNDLEEQISAIDNSIAKLEEQREYFEKLEGAGIEYRDLEGTRELDCFVGRIDLETLSKKMPDERYEVLEGEEAEVVFFQEGENREKAVRDASIEEFGVVDSEFDGRPSEIIEKIQVEIESFEKEKREKRKSLENLAGKWRPELEEAEEFLAEKVEKAEAPLEFGTTEETFVAEGWIPAERFSEMEEELAGETEGKIHVEKIEGENPPVKHQNPGPVRSFESLTDLMSVPRYNELDPSFIIFLTFPLFFGFMIGDAGYGLSSLAVFYAGYRFFPEAEKIFRSLMYASVATIIFGLIYGDAFGYIIFGHHSELAKATGIHLFEKIPILFHRSAHWSQVFQLSALIGIIHINAGYLLGFYNEHVKHGFREAFLEKGSWLLLEIAVALAFFLGLKAGAPVFAVAVILLYLGEGIAGVIEIPSLLSNVLSYLRLFGVSVAAFSLAKVVNAFAHPLFATGSLLGIAAGVLMLMVGHSFNTFIKIMEGFLQGIRLHYVEMFSKFYEGGGKKYSPFGAREI